MDLKKFGLDADMVKNVVGGVMANAGIDPVGFIIEQVGKKYPLTEADKKALREFAQRKAWPDARKYLQSRGCPAELLDNVFCEIG